MIEIKISKPLWWKALCLLAYLLFLTSFIVSLSKKQDIGDRIVIPAIFIYVTYLLYKLLFSGPIIQITADQLVINGKPHPWKGIEKAYAVPHKGGCQIHIILMKGYRKTFNKGKWSFRVKLKEVMYASDITLVPKRGVKRVIKVANLIDAMARAKRDSEKRKQLMSKY
ncbi:hypothetical protein [Saccharicrinis aurantiacus]|uniref:hypothetical protein n=1 Tax=Saccharicrinis aurantiacus TaxID=1849719 RepID=UPI00248FE41D|nr:hypothetical protein [Saccharicrinis aurantiacus]